MNDIQAASTVTSQGSKLDVVQNALNEVARWVVYFCIFMLPFSHAYVEKSVEVAVALSLIAIIMSMKSSRWEDTWTFIKSRRSVFVAMILLGVLFFSFSYTSATPKTAAVWFVKYTKFLYIPLLIPLFREKVHRLQAISALLLSVSVGVIISFAVRYGYWQTNVPNVHGMFINIINFGVLLAFAIFIAVQRMIDDKHRFWYGLLAFALTYQLLMVVHERTGFLVLSILLLFLAWRYFGMKGLFYAILSVFAASVFFILFSKGFHSKFMQFFNASISGVNSKNVADDSIAYRLAYLRTSFHLIKQMPIFGHGIGAFSMAYKNAGGFIPSFWNGLLMEPHNTYVFFWVQAGFVGFAVFVAWLIALWRDSLKFAYRHAYLLQGLVLTLAINAAVNVTIPSPVMGHFYVLFAAILLAAPNKVSI